jgi:uncharacterized membrane protein YfhO
VKWRSHRGKRTERVGRGRCSNRDGVSRIKLSAVAPCAGFLVLADLYSLGWTATVDGKDAVIYKANYAFRAVALGRGPHEVVFTRAPWSTRLGIPIAVLTFAGL